MKVKNITVLVINNVTGEVVLNKRLSVILPTRVKNPDFDEEVEKSTNKFFLNDLRDVCGNYDPSSMEK